MRHLLLVLWVHRVGPAPQGRPCSRLGSAGSGTGVAVRRGIGGTSLAVRPEGTAEDVVVNDLPG